MRFIIGAFGLVLLLTGCGGGGGVGTPITGPGTTAIENTVLNSPAVSMAPDGTAVSAVATVTQTVSPTVVTQTQPICVSKPALPSNKYRSAIMDMRFDQLNDVTADGKLVNSYDAVVRVIDKINCVGFDTIVFQTNIPIDITSGNLALYDSTPVAYNRDKNIPKDFWRLVEYSKNKGLKVFVKAIPVNHITDAIICPGCTSAGFVLPSTFSTTNFFNTLFSYETILAREAEKYKVDGFYIGVMNLGLDTTQYMSDWDKVIAQVRSVYKGKLLYESCNRCTTQLWNNIDIVAVHVGTQVSSATATSIIGLLSDMVLTNLVIDIQRIATLYQKPILLDAINIGATGKNENLGAVLNGTVPYINLQPNYNLQASKISVVFELLASKFSDKVIGVQWSEYMPWSQASWIQTPRNANEWGWHQVQFYGFDLLNNESAQKKLSEYFSKPWGYRTVN